MPECKEQPRALSSFQENTNLYGTHPFYLAMEEGGAAHGFFLLNSNAMGECAGRCRRRCFQFHCEHVMNYRSDPLQQWLKNE